jgi:ribosomal protein S18 acetylase RimI-like enzyme
VLIAETQGIFVGFAAGWVEQDDNIAETADSNRFGYISDICVMPAYRGQRIALRLLDKTASAPHLGHSPSDRLPCHKHGGPCDL